MPIAVKAFVALSIVWAVGALGYQVFAAWGGGRRDYSRRAGSPAKGVAYGFTVAMTPAHKESVSRNPVKFAVGIAMHIGVTLCLLSVVLLLLWPTAGYSLLSLSRPITALSLLAGVALLVRRFRSANLKVMSAPDDYVAMLATCGLLAIAALTRIDAGNETVFLVYAGLLMLYLPLGKLRHAVFFFVARGDYGRRLGYRGVYPPQPADLG